MLEDKIVSLSCSPAVVSVANSVQVIRARMAEARLASIESVKTSDELVDVPRPIFACSAAEAVVLVLTVAIRPLVEGCFGDIFDTSFPPINFQVKNPASQL